MEPGTAKLESAILQPGFCINCGYNLAGLNDPFVCPECGADPLVRAGDPETLVDLTTARTALEAEVIAEALRADGIPAEAWTVAAVMLPWDIAASHPIRVQVRRCDLRRARAALRSIRSDSASIDWSAVDTGDRSPLTSAELRPSESPRAGAALRRKVSVVFGAFLLIVVLLRLMGLR